MSDDLIGGLYPKPKHPNAPDFVIGGLSINVAQFREWMKSHIAANHGEEWINIQMKVSKAGKGYAAIDTWKPDAVKAEAPQQAPSFAGDDDDFPF